MWSIPNSITALRLAAGPVCLGLLQNEFVAAALVVALIAEASDFLDGYVARATGQVSNLGKLFDPLADSLYRSSVFLAFALNEWMPMWAFAVIVGRDICVSYLRETAESQVGTLGARLSGKWKAAAQGIAQVSYLSAVTMLGTPLSPQIVSVLDFLLLVATLVTMYSLVDYGVAVFAAVKRKGSESERF